MNIWKRIASCVVCAGLLLAPVNGAAEIVDTSLSVHAANSGKCGRNLNWTLDDAGTLTISGTGEMTKYNASSDIPFYYYTAVIKKVVIKPGVTSIGDRAFNYCQNLTSVTISDSVTSIGNNAFENCHSLTSVTIPDSVTSIGNSAFANCYSLTSVTIPDSVTSIGGIPFVYCVSLNNITVSAGNTKYISVDGVLYSKDQKTLISYPAGYSKTKFTIPDSVTSIEEYAFSHCTHLTDVIIPDSVTSIGCSAFIGCTRLTSVTILNPKCEIYDASDTFTTDTNFTSKFTGTIYGYVNSTAQLYATQYSRRFKLLGNAPTRSAVTVIVTRGDINDDQSVDIMDCIMVNKFLVGVGNLTSTQKEAADMNKDGDVTAEDSLALLKEVLGLQT